MSKNKHQNALPVGYDLLWYRIEKVLGHGAFGITYLAHDINLERYIALKEYLPGQFCIRKSNQEVAPLSEEHVEDFRFGLDRFLYEARTLTRFEHPNLIKVFNVFEANNTAYMVMNYEQGESLKQIHKHKKTFTEEELLGILLPLMSGLAKIHSKGFVHRDIKPGNIFIRTDNTPVLLDFGSARRTELTNPQTLTNFVSPGYAPIEQYASKSDKQGPWTDIYGLAATIYKLIVGVAPLNAIDRSEAITHDGKDCYLPLTELCAGKYSQSMLSALDHALAFRAQERPQDVRSWFMEFDVDDFELNTEAQTFRTNSIKNHVTEKAEFDHDVKSEAGSDFIDISKPGWLYESDKEGEGITYQIDADETTITATLPHKLRPWMKRLSISVVILLVFSAAGLTLYKATGLNPVIQQGLESLTGHLPVRDISPTSRNTVMVTEPAADESWAMHETPPQIVMATASDSVTEGGNTGLTTDQAGKDQSVMSDEEPDETQILLTQAAENYNNLNLTKPAGNNAYDLYLQVLKLDPKNKEARNGIRKISDAYINMAYNALDKEKTFEARRYINKAEQIWPQSNKIEPARKALNNKLAEKYVKENPVPVKPPPTPETTTATKEPESDNLLENIKEWFRGQ